MGRGGARASPTISTPTPLPTGSLYSPQFRSFQETHMAARRKIMDCGQAIGGQAKIFRFSVFVFVVQSHVESVQQAALNDYVILEICPWRLLILGMGTGASSNPARLTLTTGLAASRWKSRANSTQSESSISSVNLRQENETTSQGSADKLKSPNDVKVEGRQGMVVTMQKSSTQICFGNLR